MSFSWHFEEGAAALEGLSLAVGVGVARVIESFGVHDVALKWPNDILLSRQKVGGVLLEMMGDPVGSCKVIVGVGYSRCLLITLDLGSPITMLSGNRMMPTVIAR